MFFLFLFFEVAGEGEGGGGGGDDGAIQEGVRTVTAAKGVAGLTISAPPSHLVQWNRHSHDPIAEDISQFSVIILRTTLAITHEGFTRG